jgi:hypothetical protein
MGRISAYLTREERLRGIGELLVKGVYLRANAVEGVTVGENETHAATDGCAVVAEPPCACDEMQTAPPTRTARRASGGAGRRNGPRQSRPQRQDAKRGTITEPGIRMASPMAMAERLDRKGGTA